MRSCGKDRPDRAQFNNQAQNVYCVDSTPPATECRKDVVTRRPSLDQRALKPRKNCRGSSQRLYSTRDSGRDRDRTGKGKGRGSGGPKGGRPQLISARSSRVGAGGSRGSDFGPGRGGRNPTLGGQLGERSLKLSYGAFSGDLYIRPPLILTRAETSGRRRAAGGMIHCPTISIPDRR